MPIKQFGEALLRGMGWEKGMPIGPSPIPCLSAKLVTSGKLVWFSKCRLFGRRKVFKQLKEGFWLIQMLWKMVK
ncbi:hypothetical protein O6H91_Y013500 [Diphasiastrum complanatum]|nr:hypothetical protein O6H91_Y013500 [Diphasiastrum complanatum]